jgi:hypothetical protein
MKIFEFESDPTSTIISVAEVIRTRAANNNAPAKMDIGNFLQMVNNAGHASLDYSGLKAYFDAEPKLANVIQAFNDQEIVFVGHGDEEETAELTPPSGEAPPEEKVNKMAKRAMKARESIEEVSRATLASYQSKASDARGHRNLPIEKVDNRYTYVKKASDKLEKMNKEEVVEESPVAQAVLNRLIRQHADVVGKYGPEKVMDAVDELADIVGDVEEIGSSDVSIWTREVIEELEAREKGLQPKGLKPSASAQAYMDQMDNTHALIYNKQNRLKTGESVARGLNRYFEKQKNILKENSNYSEGDFVIINGIAYVLEKSEDGDWWGVSNNAEYEIEFTPGMEDHHQAIGEGKSPHPKGSAKHAGMSEEKEVEEGYYVMPPIDRERYTDIPGLEGPFTLRSGKVVYYDPKEGQYYDRDSDMYMSYEEYMQHDSPSMQQVKKEEVEVVEEKQKPYVSVVDGVWTVQDSSGEDVYSSKDKNKAMRFFNKYYDDMLESDDLEECPSPGPVKDYDSGPKDPYRWIRELVPTTWGKM